MVHWLWNIQTIGQYLNWDSTKALKIVFLLLKESNFAILERALNFWLPLLQSFRACLSNLTSLSIVTPTSLTLLLFQIKYFPIFAHTLFITRNYQTTFVYVQFHIIIFKPTYVPSVPCLSYLLYRPYATLCTACLTCPRILHALEFHMPLCPTFLHTLMHYVPHVHYVLYVPYVLCIPYVSMYPACWTCPCEKACMPSSIISAWFDLPQVF